MTMCPVRKSTVQAGVPISKRKIAVSDILFFCIVSFVWLFLCFKSIHVGVDIPDYKLMYETIVDDYFAFERDWTLFDQYLYYVIFKLFKSIGISFLGMCMIIYSVALIPIGILIKKNALNPFQALLIILCLGLSMMCSALRQVMAAIFIHLSILIQTKESTTKRTVLSIIFTLRRAFFAILYVMHWRMKK